MSSLVVGSVALDTVETPFGTVEKALGGTAIYFSLAASTFTDVKLVGIAGDDFPVEGIDLLLRRGIDLDGLQRHPGQTFRWVGRYDHDMNVAHTLDTQLNVFETFHPVLPEHYRDTQFVFLGNIDPELQLDVLRQVRSPVLSALDTMNFWIERKREALTEVMGHVDAILINEAEIRQYTGRSNVLEAANDLMRLGPRFVIVKRGEYGAVMVAEDDMFFVPAFPISQVKDTTGAGDSFAGGFIGYLDACGDCSIDAVRAAMVCGSVVASCTVEDFSVHGLMRCPELLRARYQRLASMTRFTVPVSIQAEELHEVDRVQAARIA